VSNPNNEGIVITASKGADNITLTAGANHDVIEFGAGGGAGGAGQVEEYTVDIGNTRLAYGQSITIDGVTITNINKNAILTGDHIANAFYEYANGGYKLGTANTTKFSGTTTLSGSGIATYVSMTGKFDSLTDDWLTSSGNATVTYDASGAKTFKIQSVSQSNVPDLNFTFSGNSNADVPADITASLQLARPISSGKGFAFVGGSAGATTAVTAAGAFTFAKVATGETSNVVINIDGTNHIIKLVATAEATAKVVGAVIEAVLTGATSGASLGTNGKVYFDGTLIESGDASSVGGNQLFGNNSDKLQFSFASSASKVFVQVIDPTSDVRGKITFDQIGQASAATQKSMYINDYITTIQQGKIEVDFGTGLLAGQSYTFNDKTIVATKDLTGAEVAEAFTYSKGEAFDGAVIVNDFTTTKINPAKVLFGIEGSKLTILDTNTTGTPSGILSAATIDITGTGVFAVNTNKITGTTTQQGKGSGEVTFADSYVVFGGDVGQAVSGGGSGSDTSIAATIKAVVSSLDTITNFDVANDKLALNKFDGTKFVAADRASSVSGDAIYVDTAGNTLGYNITSGIINFSAGNAAADAITLDMKLYVATNYINDNKIAGFEHGGDFYVIGTGGTSGATTDDLVVKLTGVSGITDIGAVLA
ncbi:MAG: hypothetical protein K2N12_09900, partial [Helicobacter sp.]|nr:hypothetical protein [Helicobacter sp.]